ncbi:MAG: hypothetical protein K6E22_05975 [Treponema sp.]|nr:hypothetical protein [Treponema sp.]
MSNDFEDIFGKPYRKFSNGEESLNIYKKPDGELVADDGQKFGNINDEGIDDILDSAEAEWLEIHPNRSDLADLYGCDESEVDDCMDDDIKDLY